MQHKRVLFVTSANLASNPRCLKEIRTLVKEGCEVTVLKFDFDNWTTKPEALLEQELKGVKWIKISATRKPFSSWLASTVAEKASQKLLGVFKNNTRLLSYAINKRSYLIEKALEKVKPNFDLVIAHNPAAFWGVYNYTKKYKIAFGADVEDYHPGETENVQEQKRMAQLMHDTLSYADYVSAASPLILEMVSKDVPRITSNRAVVNNVFPAAKQPAFNELPIEKDGAIKLFWFSQHVAVHRGIPDAINAMNLIDEFPVKLTLLGNCTETVRISLTQMLTNKKHTLVFKPACHEDELMQEAAQHHIGLALEPGFNQNNKVALSNKIFTYLLAGSSLIASDTDAQKLFVETHPETGYLYKTGDANGFAAIVKSLYHNQVVLQAMRKGNYEIAREKYSWEKEEEHFLKLVTRAIK